MNQPELSHFGPPVSLSGFITMNVSMAFPNQNFRDDHVYPDCNAIITERGGNLVDERATFVGVATLTVGTDIDFTIFGTGGTLTETVHYRHPKDFEFKLKCSDGTPLSSASPEPSPSP
jgi:hypothetical protein